jgi:stage II sporulation protein D
MRARSAATALGVLALAASVLTGVPSRPRRALAANLPRVSFVAATGSSILVDGTYPAVRTVCARATQPVLHARYAGSIEIGREPDGHLFVIGQLPLEQYLQGIAEVPRLWPLEALKAQAVAARSYALAHIRYGDPTGRELGYQLCATDACQVYLGLGVADGPYGQRWREAVGATSGQVLLYGGAPADALYFSTSNGRTVSNGQVFGTSPLPYLHPVVENDDGASPEAHWQSVIPFRDVGRFLNQAGRWPGGTVSSVRQSGSTVVLSGSGAVRSLSLADFRNDLNSWSHCLDPERYPGLNHANGTSLPQTVPSQWYGVRSSGGSAVLTGRGWGHGVGMVQWGAEGKAAKGWSSSQILAYYYGGLRPQRYAEPATIRVGIATGLTSVTIQGTGTVTASQPAAGPGPWVITPAGTLSVAHADHVPAPAISSGTLVSPSQLGVGHPFAATLSLPQLSVVRLVLSGPGGDVPLSSRVTLDSGSQQLSGRVPAGTFSGTYRLQAEVTNGIDIVRTPAREVTVAGGPSPPSTAPSPSPSPGTATASPQALAAPAGGRTAAIATGIVLGALVLALAAAAALLRARHKRAGDAPGQNDHP